MYHIECYASDQALQTFILVREEAEEENDRAASLELIVSVSALCEGWIYPQAASLLVESCDPANFYSVDWDSPPTQAAWFLRKRELDARLFVSPEYAHSKELQVEGIGAAELRAFVQEALAQPPPAEALEVTLSALSVHAVAVALPEGVALALRYPGGPLSPVVAQDGPRLRVLGPDYGPIAPPLRLHASNQHGLTRLTLELCWDFWTEQPTGRAQVRAALERVLVRGGWRLEHGELP
jgi:hypothetical protein